MVRFFKDRELSIEFPLKGVEAPDEAFEYFVRLCVINPDDDDAIVFMKQSIARASPRIWV